jgi:hypothetical protein
VYGRDAMQNSGEPDPGASGQLVRPRRRNWRSVFKSLGATLGVVPRANPTAAPPPRRAAETAVKGLWDTLTDAQKTEICFPWDFRDETRGLVRTFLANHWQVTRPNIRSDFFSQKQQWIIHDIFKGLLNPEWYPRFLRQLKDDTFGHEWGDNQSIAIFGTPGTDQFEFIITGRHLTLRADGNTEGRVALGGPILYGHAATGFTEQSRHPGNIFWPQAVKASQVWHMLDGKQRVRAVVARLPLEDAVGFQGSGGSFPGLPVAAMSADQRQELHKTLLCLVEPFRRDDQDSVLECLRQQGGLEHCSLAFYQEGNCGHDGVWDNWRLEGPAFVWYFRGAPHVHVWVHVANDPAVPLNASNGCFLHPNHDRLGAIDVTVSR